MVVGEGNELHAGMLAKACLALLFGWNLGFMVNQALASLFHDSHRKQDRDMAVRSLYKAFFG